MHRTLSDGTLLTELPNGLRVIIAKRNQTKAAAVALAVGAGSKHESKNTNGLTHLVEHMLFQGTESYPTSSALNRAVANIGGNFDATTGVEATTFMLQAPDDGLHEALAIMADTVCRPLFLGDQVARERNVVSQEVGAKADDPLDVLENAFAKLLFPKYGLGLSVTGTEKGLKHFGVRELRKLYNQTYKPDNIVLCIVTDHPAQGIIEAVTKYFGHLEGKSTVSAPPHNPATGRQRLSATVLEGNQAYAIIGGRAPAWGARERPALEVAMAALGGSLQARLPVLLRETLGEVYMVESRVEAFGEAGQYTTVTSCQPKNLEHVVESIIEGYARLQSQPLTAEEIDLARHVLIGNSVISFENLAWRAESLASRLLLHGNFMSPEDIQAEWQTVSVQDIRDTVKAWVKREHMVMACSGPVVRQKLARLLPS